MTLNERMTTFFFQLFSMSQLIHAQGNLNLTITLYPDTSDTCNSTVDGIIFTTASAPTQNECFNVAELFGGNSTFGFRNETPSSSISQDPVGVYWRLKNAYAYDPQANYSQILYQQPIANDNDNEGEGSSATRYLAIYNGEDCQQTANSAQPWYGWTCSSSAEGECEALPYSVQSFKIDDAEAVNEGDGKCWDFAKQGSATGKISGTTGSLAAIVSLATIMFLVA